MTSNTQASRLQEKQAETEQLHLRAKEPSAQNVQALAELHAKAEQEVPRHQRRIEALTAALGRPRTLYVLVAAILSWIGYNSLAKQMGLVTLDPPPFFWLQGIMTMAALLLTTMVLITQQRQGKLAARRTLLDLQVNLLAEQKVAKLIALLEELRRDLPLVDNRRDAQAEAMAKPVNPQEVISELEQEIAQAIAGQPTCATDRAAAATKFVQEVAEVVREAREDEGGTENGQKES